MSYILEALKKSQQERELGHVPTLDTPSFLPEENGLRPSLWVLSAVILAALAVVIALYSALRGSPPAPETPDRVAEEIRSTAPAPGEVADPQPTGSPTAAGGSDAAGGDLGSTPAPVPETVDKPIVDQTLVMEAPAAIPPPPPPPLVPEPPTAPAPPPPPVPAHSGRTPVPQDLIADIEAFKREVREEQSTKARPEKEEDKIAPRDLRLPKDVRKRLPEFVMSAHIYDKEPAKRFVLINGLKTREGEESREEITVEEILSDGAVLRFDGNRFFQRR